MLGCLNPQSLKVSWQPEAGKTVATAAVEVDTSPENPEVALLKVTCSSPEGKELTAVSPPSMGRRLAVQFQELQPGVTCRFKGELMNPYGNHSPLPVVTSGAK